MNYLHHSRDSRCASARDHLQPTYPSARNPETPPPSLESDIEMVDITDMELTSPPKESNQSSSIDIDILMSDLENDGRHIQPVLEEAPDVATCPSSSHAPVVFDSDEDDSDDESDRDQMPHVEAETPPTHRSGLDAETERTAQTGKLVCAAQVSSSDRFR